MTRPHPFAVGRVRVRIHSGPRKDGRYRWRADVQDGQTRRPIWSGWGTEEEATQEVIQKLAERGERWTTVDDVRTVFDLLDVWVADVEGGDRSVRTSAARRGCSERLGRSPLGSVHLDRLSQQDVDHHRRTYKGARSTLAQDLRALGAAWRWGQSRSLVPSRPPPSLRVDVREGDAVYSRHTPSSEDVAAVLDHLAPRAPWAFRAVLLLWGTGCRPGEIAGLTWASFSLDFRFVTVTGKTGRRRVPLPAEVTEEVMRWRFDERVIGATRRTIQSRLHDHLREACEALGQTRWSPYGLRRAAVQRLYRAGIDPSTAAAVLGHSPTTALRHYRQVGDEEMAAAVERAGLGQVIVLSEVLSANAGQRR